MAMPMLAEPLVEQQEQVQHQALRALMVRATVPVALAAAGPATVLQGAEQAAMAVHLEAVAVAVAAFTAQLTLQAAAAMVLTE
jgi:hypothetical protein